MRPDEGGNTPVIILISVDLPAPLSPIRPTISLRPIVRSMSCSARTGPKNFCTPSRRTMFWKLLSTTWAPVAWLTLLLPGPKTSSSFQSSNIANDSAAIRRATAGIGPRRSGERLFPRGRPAAADRRRAQRSPCATRERRTPPARLAIGAYAGPNATSGVRAVPTPAARHSGSSRSRAAHGRRRPATISRGRRRLDRRRR